MSMYYSVQIKETVRRMLLNKRNKTILTKENENKT